MFQVHVTCREQVCGGSQRVPALCAGGEPGREVLQQVSRLTAAAQPEVHIQLS